MPAAFASPRDAAFAHDFFAGYDAARRVWHDIADQAATWGNVRIVATKSRVALLARTRFAWCPQAHKAGTIFVRFITPTGIDSPRVRNDRMPDGRVSCRVRLSAADPEAMRWLHQAYRFDIG